MSKAVTYHLRSSVRSQVGSLGGLSVMRNVPLDRVAETFAHAATRDTVTRAAVFVLIGSEAAQPLVSALLNTASTIRTCDSLPCGSRLMRLHDESFEHRILEYEESERRRMARLDDFADIGELIA